MATEFGSFNFIGTLAAVINGLGIVRWLNCLADFLKRKDSMAVEHYWVYTLAAFFQFVLHVLLWWSLWSVRNAGTLNFLMYLYMLLGPILMFLASAFLAPNIDGDRLNLRQHYYSTRPIYMTLLALVWAWALLAAPVFRGHMTDAAPIYLMFLVIALVERRPGSSRRRSAQLAGVIGLYPGIRRRAWWTRAKPGTGLLESGSHEQDRAVVPDVQIAVQAVIAR
jgi:hypothetical protein